jgi:hypothetical protein
MVIAKGPKQLQHEYNTITYTITIRIHSQYPVHLTKVHYFQMWTSHSHTYLFDHGNISHVKGFGHFHPINNIHDVHN